ncbi:F-box domain-containing protein [Chloropicon primus]|uniref:F-box domain-containing protein n=1 Tax=Chloropicon primus TaxID=1764295 RepID=A0A5B8MI28_9CHLO|nr:hypothetical protein A3770_03p26440 [Chloropicon primus]UPQ99338.1 F-box domain-containing protein [Chloropicon primus]|eukprot:QDZ20126.1 hypothetical protein A3770_03p26440 [Chloropicon primus]
MKPMEGVEKSGKRRRLEENCEAEEEVGTSEEETREFEVDVLPEEILLLIVNHLDGRDLARLTTTCKTWAEVVSEESLWRAVANKHRSWEGAISKTRLNRPNLSWKQTYVNLFCLENGMCNHCFKRSPITHICREKIEEELSNPINNLPLCRFFPGLHQHYSRMQHGDERAGGVRAIKVEGAAS